MLALTGTTGKIGGAVLDALLSAGLAPPSDIVVLTSSPLNGDKVAALKEKYPSLHAVRHADYADPYTISKAVRGCDRMLLVSTPKIELDFGQAKHGIGRDGQHTAAIDAAVNAGVQHIIYTSLAFATPSKAGVMAAHLRTEAYLSHCAAQRELTFTSLREGLYNESWPLYLGHYKKAPAEEKRKDIVVAGDGPVAWTSIADLGLATAIVCMDKSDAYRNKTLFLSQRRTVTLGAIAEMLGKRLAVVSPDEYIRYYRDEAGMGEPMLRWWVSTYPSVAAGHCDVGAQSPLEDLLATKGRIPLTIEETVRQMADDTGLH